ncbi:hypothetical protein V6N12_070351 [Hibiscus sabdariffa]|uniref:Uncharacterized protein n=1 Tax=Hibiscus sabdariffa TaxID=183260 RepID=A0ABR2FGR8_9ROSI
MNELCVFEEDVGLLSYQDKARLGQWETDASRFYCCSQRGTLIGERESEKQVDISEKGNGEGRGEREGKEHLLDGDEMEAKDKLNENENENGKGTPRRNDYDLVSKNNIRGCGDVSHFSFPPNISSLMHDQFILDIYSVIQNNIY